MGTCGKIPITNKLMSLTVNGMWKEKFPSMPTKRSGAATACTDEALLVAGGNRGNELKIEVLNIENHQWSTAVDLPEPMHYSSAIVCGDQLYMLGEVRHYFRPTKSAVYMYTCSLSALLQTCIQKSLVGTLKRALSLSDGSSTSSGKNIWSKLADLPVTDSTCVTFCGQLLAIGGRDSDKKPTTAVYMYNPSANSWNVISHMITARAHCFPAVLPDNQLMVVGGEVHSYEFKTNGYSVACHFLNSVEVGDLV